MNSTRIIGINIITIISILFAHGGDHKRGGHKHDGCSIYGTVIDSITNKAIEYTSISVIDSDGTVITGGISDHEGKFKVQGIKPGKYNVKIEYMGFSSIVIKEIKLSFRENPVKSLGEIKLQPTSLELEAVKVIDDKPIFEFEADKMIYNSSDDIVAGSGTAEDVLNKVPMVTVDQDGEVSLRGNPNVKILVNGRPNRQEGDVDNIPASLIDKVEIITSPSAKYDPEGMAGIINIVLKKGKYEGFNGSFKVNGKHNAFNTISDMNGFTFYSNYKDEKYNLYSSVSINNRMRVQKGYRRLNVDDSYKCNYCYNYDFESEGDRFGNSINLGTDYSISETLNLNIDMTYKNHYKNKRNNQSYLYDNTNGEAYQTPISEHSLESEDEDNYHFDTYIELLKSYDNPNKEILFAITHDIGTDTEFESIIGIDTTFIDELGASTEIDFNYKLPLNDNSKLEVGYDGRFTKSEETMQLGLRGVDENLNESDENYEIWNFDALNDFSYNRSIHGIFAEYQYELNEKFSIKPSFRIEFVYKKIIFDISKIDSSGDITSTYVDYLRDATFDPISIDEINYFPDLHFTYNITEKKSIQFGLSKRIERPSGAGHHWGQLRPFPRSVYNNSFVFIGNPFLKPEFSTQYEISYKSPMPMGFGYINFYMSDVKDPIEWDTKGENEEEGSSGSVITFTNAESAKNRGIELFMMIMGQTVGGGYNLNELSDPSNDYNLNGRNERMNMYMRINLPEEYIKLFSYEFGFYYMKMKVPGGTLFGDKGTLWANTGISKSLFDERASISFSIDNIFDKGGFQMNREQPTDDGIKKTEILATRGGRTYSINFKINFGKMQEEKKRGRHSGRGGEGSMDMGY